MFSIPSQPPRGRASFNCRAGRPLSRCPGSRPRTTTPRVALSSAALLRAAAATGCPLSRPPQVGAAALSPGHVQPTSATPARICPSSASLAAPPHHGAVPRTAVYHAPSPLIRGSFPCQVGNARPHTTAPARSSHAPLSRPPITAPSRRGHAIPPVRPCRQPPSNLLLVAV